jgi:uncharacterized membrane protein
MNIVLALLPYHFILIGFIFALPLTFVLPGYTLTELMFHNRSLDTVHRIILSIGLSLVIDIVAGFVLNILPIGLQAISWAIFLGLITIVFSLLRMFVGRKKVLSSGVSNWVRFRWHEVVLSSLAITVVILAIRYSVLNVLQQPQPGFTQLWILPSTNINKGCAVSIGVHSFESAPVTFRTLLKVNGTQVTMWSSINLAPQSEWDKVVSIKPDPSHSIYIEVQLYREDKPNIVYRDVHLTLYSAGRGKNGQEQGCTT